MGFKPEQLARDAAEYHSDRQRLTAEYKGKGLLKEAPPKGSARLGAVSMDPRSWSFLLFAGKLFDANKLGVTIVPPETEDALNDNGEAFVALGDLPQANRFLGRNGAKKPTVVQKFLHRTHGLLFPQNTLPDNPVYRDYESVFKEDLAIPGVDHDRGGVQRMMISGFMTSSVVIAERYHHLPNGEGLRDVYERAIDPYDQYYREGYRPFSVDVMTSLLDKAMQ